LEHQVYALGEAGCEAVTTIDMEPRRTLGDTEMSSEVLSHELQSCVFESIRTCAIECFSQIASDSYLPHVRMRPSVFIDGDKWCVLYGSNLQEGVAGFGLSPNQAMIDFDKNWHKEL
jgi:hypothetical protein